MNNFDLRNYDSAFYPSTEAFTVHKFTNEEIEQFTKCAYALFNYSEMNIGLISKSRLQQIKETVEEYILAKRPESTLNELKSHEYFENTFDLLSLGSIESIQAKCTSSNLILAVHYITLIEHDGYIKRENKFIEETKPCCCIQDKAHSTGLFLEDVLEKIIEANNHESSKFYTDNSAKLNLLIENLQQLQSALDENIELACAREVIECYEEDRTKLLNQIQELEQKQKVA